VLLLVLGAQRNDSVNPLGTNTDSGDCTLIAGVFGSRQEPPADVVIAEFGVRLGHVSVTPCCG